MSDMLQTETVTHLHVYGQNRASKEHEKGNENEA